MGTASVLVTDGKGTLRIVVSRDVNANLRAALRYYDTKTSNEVKGAISCSHCSKSNVEVSTHIEVVNSQVR